MKKHTQAASTHVGRTSNPVMWHGHTVPVGTLCRKLSTHWVVEELNWLAKELGERAKTQTPSLARLDTMRLGRNSLLYHDADHYGITVQEADIVDIVERHIAGY